MFIFFILTKCYKDAYIIKIQLGIAIYTKNVYKRNTMHYILSTKASLYWLICIQKLANKCNSLENHGVVKITKFDVYDKKKIILIRKKKFPDILIPLKSLFYVYVKK